MQRLINRALQLNLKHIPIRRFSSTQEAKDQAKDQAKDEAKDQKNSSEQEIWDEAETEAKTTSVASLSTRLAKLALIWGLLGWLGFNAYYAYKADFDEEQAQHNPLYNHYVFSVSNSIVKQFSQGYSYLLYPPITKFLPDEPPLRPELLRKTLVLNFEGTLYAKDFSAGNGVLIHLRPGFKKFIDKMSQLYEIVLYSNEDTMFMNEVTSTIDPYQRYFMWSLGREFLTTMPDGNYKDLRFINRDPKRYIAVDFTADNYLSNIDNVVIVDRYDGKMEDSALKELSLFLEHCANSNVKDVRKEIKKYGGGDCAKNYYEDMQKKINSVKKKRNMLFGFGGKGKSERA